LIECDADFDMTVSGTSYLLPNTHSCGKMSGVEAIVRLSSRHDGPARVSDGRYDAANTSGQAQKIMSPPKSCQEKNISCFMLFLVGDQNTTK
jgi:hypothetical protein